jgi:hypothetical protein
MREDAIVLVGESLAPSSDWLVSPVTSEIDPGVGALHPQAGFF